MPTSKEKDGKVVHLDDLDTGVDKALGGNENVIVGPGGHQDVLDGGLEENED